MSENIAVESKWWGWGRLDKHFELKSRPWFEHYLKRYLQLSEEPVLPVPTPEEFAIPECRITEEQLRQIAGISGEEFCRTSPLERLRHAVGKSYHDLIRLRYRSDLSFPDAVLYPQTERQIEAIFQWAEANHVALVPFGGGTSVVGGVEANAVEAGRPVVTVDLCRFDKIIALDTQSLIIEAEAGIRGPALENYLNCRGFTLGHSPESFEYSTLGGWIATRSSGQFSTLYGNMEDMVESVRMITPRGILETCQVPASSTGPDMKQIVLGSEGILGIISRARLRICPLPKAKYQSAYLLPDFKQGVHLVHEFMAGSGKPALLRLSDGIETDWIMAMVKVRRTRVKIALINLVQKWLERRGFVLKQRSLMLIGLEGNADAVTVQKRLMRRVAAKCKTLPLGKWPVQMWYHNRYDNPYIRDELLNYGLLLDTLETAGEWQRILAIYEAVTYAIKGAFARLGIPGVVGAHLSHLYPQGSSLYFIIMARPTPGKELKEWWQIKKSASDAVVESGGTISHHHGVGIDHKSWYIKQMGLTSAGLLHSLKTYLDPCEILNPGKLLPETKDGE